MTIVVFAWVQIHPPTRQKYLFGRAFTKESQANQELKSSTPTITMVGGVFVLACPLALLMDR